MYGCTLLLRTGLNRTQTKTNKTMDNIDLGCFIKMFKEKLGKFVKQFLVSLVEE